MSEEKILPRYPIYVPSKGRADTCLTPVFLARDGVPFYLVVEPDEVRAYAERFGRDCILTLPYKEAGSVVPARNWIKAHATREGHERHWQLDDNIGWIGRRYRALRIPCDAGVALRACEDFTDRYENIAVAGLNYEMFLPNGVKYPPFYLNVHVYSCCLILNALSYRWRGRYNEDTDYCLQVLSGGWCTVLFNAFYVWKKWTMQMRGGNTDALYQGDGRLKMSRALERLWPGVVETRRRFRRPQHYVRDSWRKFDTSLRLKPGVDLSSLPKTDEYGMRLTEKRQVRSPVVRSALASYEAGS